MQKGKPKKKKWQDKINKWGVNPPKTVKEKYFGRKLVRLYCELFNRSLKKHPGVDKPSLHLIVGQLPSIKDMRIAFDDNEIDLRISICLFKPSGSGGGRAFNFISEICKGLELVFQPITEITDAALIGSVEKVPPHYDSTVKEFIKGEEEIVHGALSPYHDPKINIVAMNEASMLFDGKKGENKQNAMNYYQIALNPMGTTDNRLTKKLAKTHWIDYNPDCSLCLVSYLPQYIAETIVRKGFVQRLLVIITVLDMEDRIEIAKELTNLIGKQTKASGTKDDLVKRLKAVDNYWKGREPPELTKKAAKSLSNYVPLFFEPLRNLRDLPQEKMLEFSQRWIEMTWKIAWHHAILRMSESVEEEDVGYAKNVVVPLWKDAIHFIEERVQAGDKDELKKRRWTMFIIETYEKMCREKKVDIGEPIPRSEFIKRVKNKRTGLGGSTKNVNAKITKLEEEGIFLRVYDKNKNGATIPFIRKVGDPSWSR
jgi:hypothetical protein